MTELSAATRAKLESLRQKKQQAAAANRKALSDDAKKQRIDLVQAKRAQKEEDKFEDESIIEPTPEEEQRKKNMKYTIRQCEEWEKSRPKAQKAGSNFVELAQQAYKKNIQSIEIDKKLYEQQMRLLNEKYHIERLDDAERLNVLLEQKPADVDKQLLVNMVAEARTKKRRRNREEEAGVDSYISEKNRQFNMKLNRER